MKVEWINGYPTSTGWHWLCDESGYVELARIIDIGDTLISESALIPWERTGQYPIAWHFPADIPESPE